MVTVSENSSVIAEIRDAEAKLLSAVKNRDLESLDALIHENLLFIIPGGHTAAKAMDLEAHRSGQMQVEDISAHEQLFKVTDDTVVASVLIELKAQYQGQRIDGKYRYLRVWKSFQGSWKIIAGSCTPTE